MYRFSRLTKGIYGPRMINYKQNFQGQSVENLRIGNSTFIDYKENLVLKSHTYIGHHNFIEASNKITIEEGCQITSFVSITSHSSHQSIRLYGSSYSKFKEHIGYVKGSIHIGKFTFVGPHCTIMPNTTIGEGSIVSAYSLVSGKFPPHSIISGNPAKIVGSTVNMDARFVDRNPELKDLYMN